MDMPELIVSLSCQCCGGRLDVCKDMERFACAYCGTEMVVQRQGGTVAIQAVTRAIRSLQVGPDKTAAELAIARYTGELKDLQARESKLSKGQPLDSCMGFGCVGLVFLLALGAFGWPAAALGAVAVIAVLGQERKRTNELRAIRIRMRTLGNQVANKKQIAEC